MKFLRRFRSRYRQQIRIVLLLLIALMVGAALFLRGSTRNRNYEVIEIASGLVQPTNIVNAGDERLFITERTGFIRIIENGTLLPQPFLDVDEMVNEGGLEQGLLGLVFEPDYAETRRFYISYTDAEGRINLARYHADPDDPDLADPDSREILMTSSAREANAHNGGQLKFHDGYLYFSIGDGGTAPDAEALSSLAGKILRIDVLSVDEGYQIPEDNPFVDDPDARPEIWQYGFRNPWRFSFDTDGNLFIADVGESLYEEVNVVPADAGAGQHFGWPWYEGEEQGPFVDSTRPRDAFTFPVAVYPHSVGGQSGLYTICAVVGGYVYDGQNLPELRGSYFYGDWCSGSVWTLEQRGGTWQADVFLRKTPYNIQSFGVDVDGELYIATTQGTILQLGAR